MKTEHEETVKKAYRGPQLHIYGDIRMITRANDMKGNADGGKGNDKT
jgi:hypothetical protein